MSNQKDNRWYSAGDVCDLLKEMSQNHQDYLVIDCITENWEQAVHGIRYALERLQESKSLNAAAIPVNLGVIRNLTNEQGTLQTPLGELGTHWTSLVIRREPNCSFRAFYNDSLGAEMPLWLRQILENHDLPITDLKYKQQFNGDDGGLWTVTNLDRLARNEKLDQPFSEQRKELAKLKGEMPDDSDNSSQRDQPQSDQEVEKSKPRRKSPPDDDDDNDNMLQTPNNKNY